MIVLTAIGKQNQLRVNKYQFLEYENSKTAFTKVIKFCTLENVIWGKRKMKIQNRTLYISDEEGKMWEVREFFYPVEVKYLIVIYINVNKSNN